MKIPDTSANVGAYYGNEENGQWQPNGVIIDNGIGGGVVGSGDAGIHRAPLYPVHIPRHMPGYVMAGAYYPPQFAQPGPVPPQPENFDDYMWMENEEEFDKQVIQQLEEEALMEQCIEAMLEDEQRERNVRGRRNNRPRDPHAPTTSSCTSNGNPGISLEEAISKSTLNPLAAEFVPTRVKLPTASNTTEDKPESAEASSTEESRTEKPESEPEVTDSQPETTEETKTEEPLTPPKDPPEVSAADILPIQKTKQKDKKIEKKTLPAKVEVKKTKPVIVKSETKVPPKKKEAKEVRIVKSEETVAEASSKSEEAVESVPKPEPTTPVIEEATSFKPINYAAAAKATKPKPKASSPPIEKPTEKPIEKREIKAEKPKAEKKPVPKEKVRKNSAK